MRVSLCLILPLLFAGCEMQDQAKYTSYEASSVFSNGASAREPQPGTIARGDLDDIKVLTAISRDETRNAAAQSLLPKAQPPRGEKRYLVYCAPCHGRSGRGDGEVVLRGFPKPQDFSSPELKDRSTAEMVYRTLFGYKTSPPYKSVLGPLEALETVLWIRRLQGGAAP